MQPRIHWRHSDTIGLKTQQATEQRGGERRQTQPYFGSNLLRYIFN